MLLLIIEHTILTHNIMVSNTIVMTSTVVMSVIRYVNTYNITVISEKWSHRKS